MKLTDFAMFDILKTKNWVFQVKFYHDLKKLIHVNISFHSFPCEKNHKDGNFVSGLYGVI